MLDGDGKKIGSCKYEHQLEVFFFEYWGDKY
jgi:hypothetical protein